MGNKSSIPGEARRLWVNCEGQPEVNKLHKRYPDNRVVTAKYTLWTFLPVNLFEQFRRVANFYFLTLIIIHSSIDSPVSFVSILWPLVLVVGVTSIKQGYEDLLRHRGDRVINNARVIVLRGGSEKEVRSCEIRVGEVLRVSENQAVPCDVLLLCSSDPTGLCHVTTANLDGETNLKTLRCPRLVRHLQGDISKLHNFRAYIECDPPTSDLYTFHGKLEELPEHGKLEKPREGISNSELPESIDRQKRSTPLDTQNLLLRGAAIRNTKFVYGCAVYTGQHTKLTMNTRLKRNKFSTAERSVNKFLIFIFSLLFAEIVVCTLLKYYVESSEWFKRNLSYMGDPPEQSVGLVVQDALSFLVLYTYLVPIALYVSLELQNILGAAFFGWDIEMYCPDQDERAVANTSDLNEELGQVQYLFSDKTGTLTENDMVFRRCSVNGVCYEEHDGQLLHLLSHGGSRQDFTKILPAEVETFLLALAVCHSGQVTSSGDTSDLYQASSPDEKALLQAANRFGVKYFGESSDVMQVRVGSEHLQYKRLETIEFTPERRRMSVIVEDSKGQVWLVCKGAESSILPLCSEGPIVETAKHVEDFAVQGLRTLVVARRSLSPDTWHELRVSLQKARQLVGSGRSAAVSTANAALESDLTLLGSSGVEDRLQPGVKVTLESLRAAGIKVWVLTGDKVETAVNVSFSCGHLKPGTVQLTITGVTQQEECTQQLALLRDSVTSDWLSSDYCLVIDGDTLALVLRHDRKLLQELCVACTSVLACRLSPLQKSELVHLIKSSPDGPITAAVGDGANDVSMIQEAHVGIGIMGKEGRQAVRCSDFAVPKFQHLKRAFLVHGHWYYVRVANLVLYFFYKSPAFITPQLFFSITCLYSTQAFYTSLYLVCYNLFYAALPPIIYGLFEQDTPATTLLENPHLYKTLSNNSLLSFKRFFAWFANGVWHAAILYYGTELMLMTNSTSLLWDGSDAGMVVFGSVVAHCVVIVTNLKLMLVTRYWSAPFIGSILFSVFLFLTITATFSVLFMGGSTGDEFMSYVVLLASPSFWLLSLVLCIACLVPDLAYEAWKQMYRPHQVLKLMSDIVL